MRRMWQIWPGQLYPASAQQEAQFHADLTALCTRTTRPTRDDVTALMTVLRCGASLEDVLEFAPGMRKRLGCLLAAYRKLESLRSASVQSLENLLVKPTPAVWRKEQQSASVLFPVAVERISAHSGDGSRDLARAVAQVGRRIQEVGATVQQVESRLASVPATMPHAASLSSALFAPTGPCLYADPFFVPSRVSVLSPARVGDLLGEPRG